MKRKLSSHVRPLLAVAAMAMFGVAAAQTTGMGATGTTATTPNAGTNSAGTTGMRSGTDSTTQFRSLDKSNRGYLQRNEVTGITGFSFDQADLNHDGRISQDEFAQWQSSTSRVGGAMSNGMSQPATSSSGNTPASSTSGGSSGAPR